MIVLVPLVSIRIIAILDPALMIGVLTFVLILGMRIGLTPHIPIQDAHEVATKIANLGPGHTGQFIHRQQSILLGEHPELHLDLAVHIAVLAKALVDEVLNLHIDRRRQGRSHSGFLSRLGSFLHADVALDDSKEVGTVVANAPLLDKDGVIVLRQGIVDEIGGQTAQGLQEPPLQEFCVDRLWDFDACRKTVDGWIRRRFGRTGGRR